MKKKGVDKIMIIYDGDDAGQKGALSSGQLLVNEGIKVWVGELPSKMDPAKMLLEQGKNAFVNAIHGKTFEQYKMYHELSKYRLADIEKYVADRKSAEQLVV